MQVSLLSNRWQAHSGPHHQGLLVENGQADKGHV